MTYDERDPRDVPPEPEWPADEATEAEEPPIEEPPEAAPEGAPEAAPDEVDEFETATWPSRDLAGSPRDQWTDEASRAEEPPPTVEESIRAGDATAEDASVAGEVAARADEAEEAGARPAVDDVEAAAQPAGPPPSDVEAYAAPPDVSEPPLPAHSVPATEPGESTRCPRCGTENRPGIAFCRNCGQRLVAAGAAATVERPAAPEGTQACPRCGTHNRAGVAFCQNCGANLQVAAAGYVPPAVAPAPAARAAEAGGRALLGPIVLLIGAVGIATAWLLPFPFGEGSLFDRAFGAPGGYGIAFWNGYEGIGDLASQAYFGFAAPAPLLIGLLVVLAIGGFLRPAPAILQLAGLIVALVWAIGLAVLFVVVEVVGGPGGELLDVLRSLTPGGIIFILASLIVVIGALTRIGRG